MKIEGYFLQAVKRALSEGRRNFFHGAIGFRADGALVHARNELCTGKTPRAHAEARLLRKLGKHAPLVIVVRVNRQGLWMLSKPCEDCERALRRVGVKRVLYSIKPGVWGQM